MLIKCTCDSKPQTFRVRYPFQSIGTPKRVVVSRIHDTVARFHTGERFSPRYNNRGEIYNHAGVTRAGMTLCSGIM